MIYSLNKIVNQAIFKKIDILTDKYLIFFLNFIKIYLTTLANPPSLVSL